MEKEPAKWRFRDMPRPMAIYCVDVGSVSKGNFAWARGANSGRRLKIDAGKDPCKLVCRAAEDLNGDFRVTMGFECPLFVPVPDDPARLTSARQGEGSRPWSAGAGACALATGLTETVWILQKIRARVPPRVQAFLSWQKFLNTGRGLFIWEAFVSSGAKGHSDKADAEIAVRAFAAALSDLEAANAIREANVHSLVGAALLRTGWSKDLSLLKTPCVVVKAPER